jgi:hypothetical protein
MEQAGFCLRRTHPTQSRSEIEQWSKKSVTITEHFSAPVST